MGRSTARQRPTADIPSRRTSQASVGSVIGSQSVFHATNQTIRLLGQIILVVFILQSLTAAGSALLTQAASFEGAVGQAAAFDLRG